MNKRLITIILVTIFLANGCTVAKSVSSQNTSKEEESVTRIKFIMLHQKEHRWVATEKEVKDATPEAVINELLKFPMIFPEGTELLNFEVKERIAYVDMSSEFNSYNLGSSGIEQIIYSIVNTLSLNESLGITGVQFLIEGKVEEYIGEFIADEILKPNIKLSDLE
ncbi:MAG: hypothetical protein A2Y23_03200 [Clostridiales bacterium GWB2_37_7]|nr:MAG: hypothetical protein A2Y23_03200 [Clostridiales bacterium GWB2_37_7]